MSNNDNARHQIKAMRTQTHLRLRCTEFGEWNGKSGHSFALLSLYPYPAYPDKSSITASTLFATFH